MCVLTVDGLGKRCGFAACLSGEVVVHHYRSGHVGRRIGHGVSVWLANEIDRGDVSAATFTCLSMAPLSGMSLWPGT